MISFLFTDSTDRMFEETHSKAQASLTQKSDVIDLTSEGESPKVDDAPVIPAPPGAPDNRPATPTLEHVEFHWTDSNFTPKTNEKLLILAKAANIVAETANEFIDKETALQDHEGHPAA